MRVFLLLFVLFVVGCSSGEYEAADLTKGGAKMESDYSASPSEQPTGGKLTLASNGIKDTKIGQAVRPQRAVVRKAEMSVRVKDVEKAERAASDYISRSGGFVLGSESSNLNETAPTMVMSVRVPVGSFDAALLTFEGMGVRLSKKTSGEDVTAQLVDFGARLKIMRAQEDSFRNMLSKSSGSESYDLQTRLMELRGQIESLAGQHKTLSELASLSTIELSLVSEARSLAQTNDKAWFGESWNVAMSAMGTAVQVAGTGLIFLLVFAPFWAPLAYLLWRYTRKPVQDAS